MKPHTLRISIASQRIELRDDDDAVLAAFPVSTSAFGTGTEPGSLRTPLGRFRICEKIGEGAMPWAVFKSRVPTGEIGVEEMDGDLVLTRILWLDGLDPDNANTRDRYIYIHGTNHESAIGTPASHGCIRMRNDDVIRLFDAVETGDEVLIQP